jgi:hypothetical protein
MMIVTFAIFWVDIEMRSVNGITLVFPRPRSGARAGGGAGAGA